MDFNLYIYNIKFYPCQSLNASGHSAPKIGQKQSLELRLERPLLPALLHLSINAEKAKENYFLRRPIIRWREAKKRYFLQPIVPSEDL